MSLFRRFTNRLTAAAGATFGSEYAKGTLERLNVTAQLRRDWGRFLGHRGGPPTMGAMCAFLQGCGIDLSAGDAADSRLSGEQQERMLSEAALAMIRSGAVEFGDTEDSARDLPFG